MVKSVAEKHGLRATFMPKPIEGLTGNGCHAHVSVWDKAGKTNVFAIDPGSARPASSACPNRAAHFLGGIMKHASALAAITNPTVNLQAHQRAAHVVGGDLGAQHRDMDRQQPHPHGARAGAGPVRTAPARWRGQPLPAAGGHHRRGPRRHGAPRPIPASATTSTCMPRATR
jgi:hypothetical protein